MLGKLLYQFRSRFSDGFRVAWYRDVVRKRILETAPVDTSDSTVAEIHVLTSERDWLNLLWALKSFYHASKRRYALCIHDDGSLNDAIRHNLAQHFPTARILKRDEADKLISEHLEPFPRCQAFRASNLLSPKVFDFRTHLIADRMILLDSDVLFFSEPKELLRRVEDASYGKNSVNGDVTSAYTVSADTAMERCGVDLVARFNSGLGVIHRDSLRWDWVEEFLELPNIESHFWRIEQTLYALCSSRFGVELLPSEYDVFLNGTVDSRPSRHYVGSVRHLMYGEGIRKLCRRGWVNRVE